jgi:hypothetical protein
MAKAVTEAKAVTGAKARLRMTPMMMILNKL